MVVRIVNPDPDEIDEPTGQWLDDMDLVLDHFRYDLLPRDFPFDFSPDSLATLEPLLVDEWPADGGPRTVDGLAAGALALQTAVAAAWAAVALAGYVTLRRRNT